MITIISASNRMGNLTALFSQYCKQQLESRGEKVKLFDLNSLDDSISLQSVYDYGKSEFTKISDEYIVPADKLLFVLPEYNGSFPGVLKLFIDAIEPPKFYGKSAALIGIAAGRAGNLRGMDHLSDILNYLQVAVMPQKLPISKINELISDGQISDETTKEEMNKQLDLLLKF